MQIDHLQMSVKLYKSEIDALFLGIEDVGLGEFREVIIPFEAKGRNDDILEDQVLRQVQAIFNTPGITQDTAVPIAVKALRPSEIHLVEFQAVTRSEAPSMTMLTIASEAVYIFVPPIPGVGEK